MEPVRTSDCDVVYKGPNEQIGDLWCHRVRPGYIRVTYEPTPEELEVLKAGGRVQLSILREPIPPVMLSVVIKEESEPIAPHGWKIDKKPGDKLEEEEESNDEEDITVETERGYELSREAQEAEESREAPDAVST